MGTIIDEFMVKMKLDGKEWAQDAKEVEQSIKGVKEELKNTESAGESFGGMAEGLKGKLMGLVGAFTALYGVQQTFMNYLSTADAMGKFADSIGQNIEDVHAWSEAVIRSGGSAEGFQGSLKSLTTQLSKMATTGQSRAGRILESVGIDAGTIGNARKSLDVMMEIADKMQGMSKEEAFGFGSSLGLDSGTIMLLQQGRDAVGDLINKQKALGVFTKEDAKVTAEFNDAVADSKQAFMGLSSIVFRMVTPAFQGIVDGFTSFVSYLQKHEVAIQSFFVMLATIITAKLIPSFLQLFKTVATNPYVLAIAGLTAIALAIEDLYTWANNGDAAFGEFWESLFGSKEEALQFFEDMKGLANDVLYIIKELAGAWREVKKAYQDFTSNGGNARLIVGADGDINAFGDEYHDALQEKFESLYTDNMTMKPETQANIGSFLGEAYENAFINIEEQATEAGQKASENMTNSFFSSFDEFLIRWNNNGFFEAWTDESEKSKEAVTSHFDQQGKAILSTGKTIDVLNSKLDALRQNIMTMPVYNPSMAFAGGATYNSANTRIGAINVNTQATDASGIGASIGPAMSSGFNPFKSNGGAF